MAGGAADLAREWGGSPERGPGPGLARAEALLTRGEGGFAALLESLRRASTLGAPCTAVWTAGSIAYRCRTCQTSESSAVCMECFKLGGHEQHDYVLYRSTAGGCCDCGDLISWKASGCCPLHRQRAAPALSKLPEDRAPAARAAFALVLSRLVAALEEVADSSHGGLSVLVGQETAQAVELLQWLQKTCSAAALRVHAAEAFAGTWWADGGEGLRGALESVELEGGVRAGSVARELHEDPQQLLSRLLHERCLPRLPAAVMEQTTTLLLLLLYNPQFKGPFTRAILREYSSLVWRRQPPQPPPAAPSGPPATDDATAMAEDTTAQTGVEAQGGGDAAAAAAAAAPPALRDTAEQNTDGARDAGAADGHNPALSTFLDRVTVQLFNSPEVTLSLVKEGALLDTLLGLLDEMTMTGATGPHHTIDVEGVAVDFAPRLDMRSYQRVLNDLHMVLAHPPVARFMMHDRSDLLAVFLRIFLRLQGMNAVKRKTGEHVVFDNTLWSHALSMEIQLVMLFEHTLQSVATLGPGMTPVGAANITAGDYSAIDLPSNANDAAAHVANILHGVAEATAAATERWVILDTAREGEDGPWDLVRDPVSVHLPLHRATAACVAVLAALPQDAGRSLVLSLLSSPSFTLLAEHPLRVLAWSSQVRARMWVRNGDEVARMERVYRSSFWHEHALDLDVFAIQLGFASSSDRNALTQRLLHHFGCLQIASTSNLPDQPLSGPTLACLTDAAHLLVVLARERRYIGLATPRQRLYRELVHWLYAGEQTHTQLTQLLPQSLVQSGDLDAVLSEVALYTQPRVQDRGRYALKPGLWRDFDPFFMHFSRTDLEEAFSRALNSKQWQPEWQLQPPALPAPQFESISAFLHATTTLKLAHWSIRYCVRHPAPAAEDLATAGVQLLALALGRSTPESASLADDGDLAVSAHLLALTQLEKQESAGGVASLNIVQSCAQELLSRLQQSGLAAGTPPPARSPGVGGGGSPGVDTDALSEAEAAKEERRKAMRARQAAVMAQMAAMQNAFAESTSGAKMEIDSPRQSTPSAAVSADAVATPDGSVMASPGDAEVANEADEHADCVLCRGEGEHSSALGLVAQVQRSCIPAFIARGTEPVWDTTFEDQLCSPCSENTDVQPGLHVQCCGHRLHAECLARYKTSLFESRMAGQWFEGMQTVVLNQGEFLCPVCRRIGNALIPSISLPSGTYAAATMNADVAGASLLDTIVADARVALVPPASLAGTTPFWHSLEADLKGTELFLSRCRLVALEQFSAPLSGADSVASTTRGGLLWLSLAHNIAHIEVISRPTDPKQGWSDDDSPLTASVLTPQWSALRALVRLAFVASLGGGVRVVPPQVAAATAFTGSTPSQQRAELLHWLVSGTKSASLQSVMVATYAAMEPTADADQGAELPRGQSSWKDLEGCDALQQLLATDSFALLIEVLAQAVGVDGAHLSVAGGIDHVRSLTWLVATIAAAQASVACVLGADGADLHGLYRAAVDELEREPRGALSQRVARRFAPFVRRAATLLWLLEGHDEPPLLLLDCTDSDVATHVDAVLGACGMPSLRDLVSTIKRSGGGTCNSADALEHWCRTVVREPKGDAKPLSRPQLVKLPELFQDLFVKWVDHPCSVCGVVPQEPALCLACMQLLCTDERRGGGIRSECTRHAMSCGAGTSVFLLVHATKLLIVRGRRHIVYSSPYLDAHGEEDLFLRRGRPLRLSVPRYAAVNQLWRTSGWDADSHTLSSARLTAADW